MGLEAVPPNLRDAVDSIVAACRHAFGDRLRCVIVKGSALKGDFVPGYSDLDVHAYVDPEALRSDRTPTLEHALRLQEAIGGLEPRASGASQFQVYFLRADRMQEDWSPPVPGSYTVAHGTPPPALLDWESFDFLAKAERDMARIIPDIDLLIGRFADKPDRSIAAIVRLAGSLLKGHAYSSAILASGNPKRTLSMPTADLLRFLENVDSSLSAIGRFFDLVTDWQAVEQNPGHARTCFRAAIEALEAVERWATTRIPGPPGVA